MGNNIAILTDTAKTVTLDTINDYGAGVFAHVTQDFAQHTQINVYPVPYALETTTVNTANLNIGIYKSYSIRTKKDTSNKNVSYVAGVNFYGSLTSTDIQFYADNSGNWNPFGLNSYAADITGLITVTADGTYEFILGSDDGSDLFIDGTQVINNLTSGAYHKKSAFVPLSTGNHAIEVQLYQYVSPSPVGVDLFLPNGVSYSMQTVTKQNILTTQSLYMGLTINNNLTALALPVNSTGTNVAFTIPPIILVQPQNVIDVVIGNIAQFSVAVLSSTQVNYQWQTTAYVPAPGQLTLQQQAEALQITISALPAAGFNQTLNSSQRALQLVQRLVSELPVSSNTAPPSAAVTDSQALVPLVVDPAVSQQIQKLVVAIQAAILVVTEGLPFTDLASQTGSSLVLTNVQPGNAGLYRIVVSNANGSVISSYGTLVVTTL